MASSLVKVLVVEADLQLLKSLRITLAVHDYEVATASDGATALLAVAETKPDVVVLDLGLPDVDGVEVIDRLRRWTNVPVVAVSGSVEPNDLVRALDAGADDYVRKPFWLDEFLARLRAVRRRAVAVAEPREAVVLDTGSFSVDLAAKKVTRGGAQIHLTRTEWGMLELLTRHHGRLVTHHELLEHVWGPNAHAKAHYLRVYLNRLRQKLEPDPAHPRHLITQTGIGYRLETPDEPDRPPSGASPRFE